MKRWDENFKKYVGLQRVAKTEKVWKIFARRPAYVRGDR